MEPDKFAKAWFEAAETSPEDQKEILNKADEIVSSVRNGNPSNYHLEELKAKIEKSFKFGGDSDEIWKPRIC